MWAVHARRPQLFKDDGLWDRKTTDERVQDIELKIETLEGKVDDVLELLRGK